MTGSQKAKYLLICVGLTQNVFAETEDDLMLIHGSDQMQSIASGRPLPQSLSPSVTSVMTAKDIERIGARRLTDVLEYLPGVHVSNARNGVNVIGFRGVYSETNAQVLILINGVPVRNTLFGGKPYEWNLPVKNIAHIEVIRGPGSMLYGGDATTGVINIILKTGKALKGGDAGGFFGNQDTYEGWAEYGDESGDIEYSVAIQGGSTNGYEGRVNQDAQTVLDNQFGTNVSNAPGFTNNGRGDIDARLDVAYKDMIRLRAGYQGFRHVETGIGAAYALDDTGGTNNDIYNLDLSLNNEITDTVTNKTTFYFLGQNPSTVTNLLPAGTFGGLLPSGAINSVSGFQGTTGLTTQINYVGIKKHTITGGTGLIYNWNDGTNKINYIITPTFVQQIPLTEVSAFGRDPLLASKERTNYYALIQDEWNFSTDWYLTTGFRYDYYSDVSPGYSPRIALVWNVDLNLTTKLLYSRAFRPPSFLEKNLPLTPGTTIKAETVNTVEFQIEKKWSSDLLTSANVYWFKQDNLITSTHSSSVTPVGFRNSDPIDGIGFETEAKYTLNSAADFAVSYSYHGLPSTPHTGLMPEHMVKGLIHWDITDNWGIGTQLNWIGERKRPSDDPRSNLSDYFTAGLTLSTKIAKPIEFTFRINNIFNATLKEPTLNPILFPGDESILGRTVLGQVKATF
ncbi:MAG: TonB-dependent receptor [Methylicorpusculum sp.]|uniref:TonB-dependent receptor plug domain-containing protein n=1 Tax=Methylicorpusculum sp. TaxID=2713644 RepID=UPI00272FBE1B|nr:TonB-dependent receptor [Methylicorpusculum sp.]MDP2200961.1 TonB-dependent receptor [Methylicorpusculum sp.]